jgi:hypothetical protein
VRHTVVDAALELDAFARSQANCFSHASRFGMVIAIWLIATGWSNIDQFARSFGSGSRAARCRGGSGGHRDRRVKAHLAVRALRVGDPLETEGLGPGFVRLLNVADVGLPVGDNQSQQVCHRPHHQGEMGIEDRVTLQKRGKIVREQKMEIAPCAIASSLSFSS